MSGNFGTDIKLLLNKVSLVFLVKLLIYDNTTRLFISVSNQQEGIKKQ